MRLYFIIPCLIWNAFPMNGQQNCKCDSSKNQIDSKGYKQGLWQICKQNQLHKSINYKNDTLNGDYVKYRNCKIKEKAFLVMGFYDGERLLYDEKGQLQFKTIYKNRIKIVEEKFVDNKLYMRQIFSKSNNQLVIYRKEGNDTLVSKPSTIKSLQSPFLNK